MYVIIGSYFVPHEGKILLIVYIYCLGTRGIASLLSLETQLLLEAQPRAIVGAESDNKLAIPRGSSQ